MTHLPLNMTFQYFEIFKIPYGNEIKSVQVLVFLLGSQLKLNL